MMTIEDRLAELEAKVKAMEKGTTSKKKPKDPNAPKRPENAYMKFCREKRETVRSENPTMKLGDIAKVLGKMWNELSEDEKESYKKNK